MSIATGQTFSDHFWRGLADQGWLGLTELIQGMKQGTEIAAKGALLTGV
ncbi:MAG: hypothetical protein AAF892_13155 [Cyanobacteria bacterium P01_D01_bin.71]